MAEKYGLLPVHLKPKADELLSSWLVRLAIAHVMKPDTFYSLLSPLKPKIPPYMDEAKDDEFLFTFVFATGTSLDKVRATTLAQYKKALPMYFIPLGRSVPRPMSSQWILPINHQDSLQQLFGLQYCSNCLLEDETPYFRRRWRLGFVTFCGTHRVLLLDRCTNCGLPVDPKRNASKFKKNRKRLTMTECYSCDFDIRTATPPLIPRSTFSYDLEMQELLLHVLESGAVTDNQGNTHLADSFFHKLYELGMLLTLGGFGRFIRTQLCRRYRLRPFTITHPENYNRIELLNVRERYGVIRVASRVMAEWLTDWHQFHWWNRAEMRHMAASIKSATTK